MAQPVIVTDALNAFFSKVVSDPYLCSFLLGETYIAAVSILEMPVEDLQERLQSIFPNMERMYDEKAQQQYKEGAAKAEKEIMALRSLLLYTLGMDKQSGPIQ